MSIKSARNSERTRERKSVGTSSDAAIEALKQNDILKAVLKQHGISLPASVTATPAAEDPETGVTQQTQASPPGDCSLSDPELAAAIQQSMLCSSATPPKVWNNRAAGDRDGDCGGRVCLVVDKFGERRKNNARFEVYSRCEKKLAALQEVDQLKTQLQQTEDDLAAQVKANACLSKQKNTAYESMVEEEAKREAAETSLAALNLEVTALKAQVVQLESLNTGVGQVSVVVSARVKHLQEEVKQLQAGAVAQEIRIQDLEVKKKKLETKAKVRGKHEKSLEREVVQLKEERKLWEDGYKKGVTYFGTAAARDQRTMRGTKRQRADDHQNSLKELDALYKHRIGDSTYYDLGPVLRKVGSAKTRAKVAKLLMDEKGDKEVVAQRLGTVDGLLGHLKAQVLASGKKWNHRGKEKMIVCSEDQLPFAILMMVIFTAKGKSLFDQVKPIISAASLMHNDPEGYAKQMAKFFNF